MINILASKQHYIFEFVISEEGLHDAVQWARRSQEERENVTSVTLASDVHRLTTPMLSHSYSPQDLP